MATTSVDQVTGYGETVAYKAPCRLATTGNITLSGLQTIDGSVTAADDRVLVKNQTDGRENGIYIASAGLWQRARDLDSNRDVTKGTRVSVTDGTVNIGTVWLVSTDNPIVVGTSVLTFVQEGSQVYQPLDADLTAIAALSTAPYGRSLLTLASSTALQAYAGVREVLTGARTYYVRTDGSDANTGLVNSAGGAFLTIQKAANVARALDNAGFAVTISAGDGTRTVGAIVTGPIVGGGAIDIIGNIATPANCVVNTTSADIFTYTNGASGTVRGFKLTTTAAGSCLTAQLGAILSYGNIEFGTCAGLHVNVGTEANCFAFYDYTISGGAVGHFHTGAPGGLYTGAITITLTGTPAFSAYFSGTAGGYQDLRQVTFVGGATGKRYLAHKQGYIDGTTSQTFLPGDVAGTTESGGKYGGDVTWPDIIGSTGAVDGSILMASGTTGNLVKASGDAAILASATTFSPQVQFRNTANDANAAYILLQKLRGAAAVQVNDNLGNVIGQGADSGGTLRSAAGLNFVATAIGASSVDALFDFQTSVGGAFATRLRLAAGLYNASATGGDKGAGTANFTTAYYLNGVAVINSTGIIVPTGAVAAPQTNDGAALGTTVLQWSDLFLATGGVVNWNNGDVLITHSANRLAFTGAASGYTFDAAVLPSANDAAALGASGTAFADLFLASGGVINFNASDVSITHSADMLSFTGAANGWRFGAQVSPTGNDGTSLGSSGLAFSDLFLADGAVINFNAGNYTITHSAGIMTFSGPVIAGAGPVTKNADFTLAATESSIIVTKGSSCVATLGTATAGRRVRIKTHAAFTTVSASSNVVPRAGGAAGTAILAAVAGSWAELEGDGTNWQIMSGA